jgi:hypothetical protein
VVTHGKTNEASSALYFTMHRIAWEEKEAGLRLFCKLTEVRKDRTWHRRRKKESKLWTQKVL